MNKRNLKILALLILGVTGVKAVIDEFRTPIPLERGYAFSHYPFARPDYGDCKNWYLDIWGAGWHKNANFAFPDKDTTSKVSLSNLFFGAPSFTLAQIVTPGTLPPAYSLLSLTSLTPTFDYNEIGAIFGVNLETVFGCDCQWHAGVRARVPFRSLKTALNSCCALEESTSITDLYVLDNERVNCPTCNVDVPVGMEETVQDVFAIRLDLASALFEQQSGVPPLTQLLVYGNGTTTPPPVGDTEMFGIDITNVSPGLTPVYLIESDGGGIPTPPFGLIQPDVADLPMLPLSGVGAGTGSRYVFEAVAPYAGSPIATNPALQKNFWIAPAINNSAADPDLDLVDDADTIRNELNTLLQFHQINNISGLALLSSGTNAVSFDTIENNGLGNFDLEFYLRHDLCDCCVGHLFAEGIIGARFPTDTRVTATNNLLLVPTGNNKHYEAKIGGFVGWSPIEWFAVKADAWYYWVLSKKETVPAPFMGATVANIGPGVPAKVRWSYFIGDIDFTFLIPCLDSYVGFDVGYQAWVKQKTHVDLSVSSATSFFGTVLPLDATILENNTKRVAHTIKAEIFRQTCDWQIYAGWNHAVAGKNALNDSDWYLGLEVYF